MSNFNSNFGSNTRSQVATFALFALAFNLTVLAVVAYVGGSVVTSGIKAATDSCGTSYSVPVVAQDWFCSEAK